MSESGCIFCKIASGQIPAAKIIDAPGAIAFPDIGPLARGHVLLIPRKHAATIDQLTPEETSACLQYLPALSKAVQQVTGCQGVNVLQNNGRVAHQVVMHVHFHIIPRNEGDEFHFNWPAGSLSPDAAQELAKAIRAKL